MKRKSKERYKVKNENYDIEDKLNLIVKKLKLQKDPNSFRSW